MELKDLFLVIFSLLFLILMVLVGVAFLTLMERKVLGYIQIRKGPNKLGYLGLLQPFSDAIKLFSNEQIYPYLSNYLIYYLCPLFNLFFSLLIWFIMPFLSILFMFEFSLMFFFCISSLGVYTIMLSGWSSNSIYSLLGGLRSIAQSISYEVSLGLVLMSMVYLILSLNIFSFMSFQFYIWFIFFSFPISLMWMISSIAETNRTPFDFSEGESELVSGFNVEYSSGSFAMIFMAEYSSIIFMSVMFVMIFMGFNMSSFFFFLKLVFISFIWIWIRGTLPRFRYDKLMYFSWKIILPCSLLFIFYYLGLKIYLISI